MTALAFQRRRQMRYFPTTIAEDEKKGMLSRIAFATGIMAIMVAAGFTVADLAMRTADQVFYDRAMLNPPEQADVSFGNHRVSFPGEWLTSPLALQDEMATTASISVDYDKLLSLVGATSALDTPDGTNPRKVVVRLQMPPTASRGVDLLGVIHLPKSEPVAVEGPAGLTVRQFRERTGYDGELLYLGREGDREFAARCLQAGVADGTSSVRRPCIFTQPISADLEAVVQFETDLLADWRQLGVLVEALVDSITVR